MTALPGLVLCLAIFLGAYGPVWVTHRRYTQAGRPWQELTRRHRRLSDSPVRITRGCWLPLNGFKVRFLSRYGELRVAGRSVTVAQYLTAETTILGAVLVRSHTLVAAFDPEGEGWVERGASTELRFFLPPEESTSMEVLIQEAVEACEGPAQIAPPGQWLDSRKTDATEGERQFQKGTIAFLQLAGYVLTVGVITVAAAALLPGDWPTWAGISLLLGGPTGTISAGPYDLFLPVVVAFFVSQPAWAWGFLGCANREAYPALAGRWSVMRTSLRITGWWLVACGMASAFLLALATITTAQFPLWVAALLASVVGSIALYKFWKTRRLSVA